jgi:hypothetical protein
MKKFDNFPTRIKLFVDDDVITEFHASSLKDYKEQLYVIIEERELYHTFIDTYAVEGNRYNQTLIEVESFLVASQKTWIERKTIKVELITNE